METNARRVAITNGSAQAALTALIYDISLYTDRPEKLRDVLITIQWEDGSMVATGTWMSNGLKSEPVAPIPHPSASAAERLAWAERFEADVVGWRS